MKRITWLLITLIVAFAATPAFAQETEPDPAVQAAKEETAVVYDLGRFFGYVWRLEQEYEDLALGEEQMESFYEVMNDIRSMTRIEPDWAEAAYENLELDVLSVDQLMQVDMFVLARDESRSSGIAAGTGAGSGSSGSGSGPILTYINGGAFNPIVDETKPQGADFAALFDYLKRELGR